MAEVHEALDTGLGREVPWFERHGPYDRLAGSSRSGQTRPGEFKGTVVCCDGACGMKFFLIEVRE